ncbi:hypothetical protein MMPV_001986 [Pyropia vietnamensis]
MWRRRRRSPRVVVVTSVAATVTAATSLALSGLSMSCAQGAALLVVGGDDGGGRGEVSAYGNGGGGVGSSGGVGSGGGSGGISGDTKSGDHGSDSRSPGWWTALPSVSPVAALWADPVSVRSSVAAVPQLPAPLVSVLRAAGVLSDGILPRSSRALRDWALAGTYRYTGMNRYISSGAYRICPATLIVRDYEPASLPRDQYGSLWLPPSAVVWNGTDVCVDGGVASAASMAPVATAGVTGEGDSLSGRSMVADHTPSSAGVLVIRANVLFSDPGAAAYPDVLTLVGNRDVGGLGVSLAGSGLDYSILVSPRGLRCGSAAVLPPGSLTYALRDEENSLLFGGVAIPPAYKTLFMFVAPLANVAGGTGGLCALSTAWLSATGDVLAEGAPSPAPTDTPAPLATARPPPVGNDGDGGVFAEDEQPSPSGSQREGTSLSSSCFPAAASVTLASGRVVSMRSLRLGDEVVIGGGRLSTVYAFSHADGREAVRHPFVRLATTTGVTLTASPGHYVYVLDGADRRLVLAAAVRVGDVLPLATGTNHSTVVVGVSRVALPGLYNPHTLDGDIAVDGVVVSTWTVAVPPAVAAAALAPLRWLLSYSPDAAAVGVARTFPG